MLNQYWTNVDSTSFGKTNVESQLIQLCFCARRLRGRLDTSQ